MDFDFFFIVIFIISFMFRWQLLEWK